MWTTTVHRVLLIESRVSKLLYKKWKMKTVTKEMYQQVVNICRKEIRNTKIQKDVVKYAKSHIKRFFFFFLVMSVEKERHR